MSDNNEPDIDEDDDDKVSPDIADYDGRTGLHLACAYNQFEIVKFFIEVIHANINFKDNFGRTALREAVESKADDAIISYLVSNGAKLEISKNEAASKLCSLVEEKNINLLEKWRKALPIDMKNVHYELKGKFDTFDEDPQLSINVLSSSHYLYNGQVMNKPVIDPHDFDDLFDRPFRN